LEPVTSATRSFLSLAALRSMWSEPIPTLALASYEAMVGRTNTSSDAGLQILGLGNALGVDVTRVERGGDNNLGIDNFLVEGGALAFLVVGDDKGVALRLEPLSETEFILNCAEQSGLFLRPFAPFIENRKNFDLKETQSAALSQVSGGEEKQVPL